MKSYFSHLECTNCGKIYPSTEPIRTCLSCSKVIYARYDLEQAKSEVSKTIFSSRAPNMWRYFELLPVLDNNNIVSLGEGFTPIHKADNLGDNLGLSNLLIKDESFNPTASFKARGMSAAVSKVKEFNIKELTVPSAGNAGGALAAYAAKAGLQSHIFMPQDAPEATQKEVSITNATLNLVDGFINDAGVQSRGLANEKGMFDLSTLQEPYRAEGKKTMGYEIAEQLGWNLPDAIIYPTGGGTGIVGIWKAIKEMEQLGWISGKRPKMFCIQAEGCAPLVQAFNQKSRFAKAWAYPKTIAAGMRVPSAIGDYLILDAVYESGGSAMTVTDDEMIKYVKKTIAMEGLFLCPEGGATVCASKKLLDLGLINEKDSILLLNTGSGFKYMEII